MMSCVEGEFMTSAASPGAPVTVKSAWCKSCGICISVCPKNVLEFGHDGKATPARPDDCIQCQMCEMMCPDLAITVVMRAKATTAGKEGASDGR